MFNVGRRLLHRTIGFESNHGVHFIPESIPLPIVLGGSRSYAFKSDLKIKWVRPAKIPSTDPIKSGDCSKLPAISGKTLLKDYEKSEELKTASDTVRSLFELQNNRNHETSEYYRHLFVSEVQRHRYDVDSPEVQLARMTASIRRNQEYVAQNPHDKVNKQRLKELIEKRKKFLKKLRKVDYRRFEWLLEKLDLVYKPPPDKFHWITRKESLQKLTNIHCLRLRNEKLLEYRKVLEAQQIPFLEEAIKKMTFVRQEQIDLGIDVTISEESIEEYRNRLQKAKALHKDVKARTLK